MRRPSIRPRGRECVRCTCWCSGSRSATVMTGQAQIGIMFSPIIAPMIFFGCT
jgi:hypothetical protein